MNIEEPNEHRAARLAARAAAYREQVARLRQLVTPPAYLDARRDLTTHPRNESAATEEDANG